MGLLSTAAAFGAGYTMGRPDGRARVKTYLGQARELANTPEAKRLRERARDIAGQQIAVAKRRLDALPRSAAEPARGPATPADRDATTPAAPSTPSPVPDTAASGFAGTTVIEDSRAVLGQDSLPPARRPGTPGPTPTSS